MRPSEVEWGTAQALGWTHGMTKGVKASTCLCWAGCGDLLSLTVQLSGYCSPALSIPSAHAQEQGAVEFSWYEAP